MTPEQWLDLVTRGGAIAVLLGVGWLARRGDIRFRPGVDGELAAMRDALADARSGRNRAEAHADRLVGVVDKLGDALEARNRRDEQHMRAREPS